MAHLKSIAAVVIALFAIVFEVQAIEDLSDIGADLNKELDKKSEDRASDEKAYLFAKNYISNLGWIDKRTAGNLLPAWHRVLHRPDLCDRSSLLYVATLAECWPEFSMPTKGLVEATKKYATKCLNEDYIRQKIDSLGNFWRILFSTAHGDRFIIDHWFIRNYWSNYQGDRFFSRIDSKRATLALRNAIDGENDHEKRAYLKKHLIKPCLQYEKAFKGVVERTFSAGKFLEGGPEQFIRSLDTSLQNVFFRYQFCKYARTYDISPPYHIFS